MVETRYVDLEHEKWYPIKEELKWFGPFVSESSKDYFFKSWNPEGLSWGLTAYQRYDPDELWISWTDRETGKIIHTMVLQKPGEIKLSFSPFEPPSDKSQFQDRSDTTNMEYYFNFRKQNSTFNLDKLGRACFSNPIR